MSETDWSKLSRDIEALAGPASRAWLAAAAPVKAEAGVLSLRVPNRFVRDALRERCGGALLQAAKTAGFARVEVEVAPATRTQKLPELSGFASFRVTPANQMAYATVSALSRKLRFEIHPLVLHGPAGCGKSHLLSALAAGARMHGINPITATDAPRLASRIALSARDGKLPAFRTAFRATRLLILDKGERLAGKEKTQVELVHALDVMSRDGGVAVLALREPPASAPGLSDRLRSRLQGGLVVGIEA